MSFTKLQIIAAILIPTILQTDTKISIENEIGVVENCLLRTIFNLHEDIWFLEKNFSSINYDKLLENSSKKTVVLSSHLKHLTMFEGIFYNTHPILVIHNLELNNYARVFNSIRKTTKILIITSEDYIKTIFALAYEFKFVDLTVAVCDEHKLEFYTWFFWAPENVCGKYLNLTLFRTCNRNSTNLRSIFPKKYTKKPVDCVAKVGWWTSEPFVINPFIKNGPGLYVSTFKAISESSGISLVYEKKNLFAEKEFLNEGFYNHISTRLENGQIDILLGHVFMNYSNLAYGPVFYKDSFLLVAPIPKRIRKYGQLFKVFKLKTMFLVGIVYLVTVFCFVLMKNLSNLNTDYFWIFFEVFSLTTSISIRETPKTLGFRLLFMYYIFYGIIIDTFYLSKLSSIFGNPEYESAITDRYVLYHKNITTHVSMFIDMQLMLSYSIADIPLTSRLFNVSNDSSYTLFNRLASEQEEAAVVFSSQYYTYEFERLAVDEVYIDLYYPCTLYNTYALKTRNFINEIINYWAQEAIEKGIFLKHWSDISVYYRNTSLLNPNRNEILPHQILSSPHFEQISFIMLYGYILGFVFLMLEFIFSSITKVLHEMKNIAPF